MLFLVLIEMVEEDALACSGTAKKQYHFKRFFNAVQKLIVRIERRIKIDVILDID